MAKETTTPVANAAEEALLNEGTQAPQNESAEETTSNFAAIVRELKRAANSKRYTCKVTNVTTEDKGSYTRHTFVVDKDIRAYDADGEEATTHNVFTSNYAISGLVKQDEELAWLGNAIAEDRLPMNLIFTGATIEVVQEYVAAGTSYVNPFSSKKEESTFEHDVFINHIVGVKLGKTGSRFADKFADKLLDAAFE